MEMLYVLLPVALGFVLAAIVTFRWAVRNGQYDDLDTPPYRALLDEEEKAS